MIILLSILLGSALADDSLQSKLSELAIPENQTPAGMSLQTSEKLYAIQTRYSNLARRFEVSLAGARNFNSSSFINAAQFELALRYHISNRVGLVLSGAYGTNSYTSETQTLIQEQNRIPDLAYVKYRTNLLMSYNLFYGKFRLGSDSVAYFDQYIAAGPGLVMMQTGNAFSGVVDAGFAFWLGRNASVRFGVKGDIYQQKTIYTSSTALDLLGHIDIGYVFGAGT